MELTIIVKNTSSIYKFKKRFMNIRQKMVFIVISGILLSAVLSTTLIYNLVQRKVLANEAITLEKSRQNLRLLRQNAFRNLKLNLKV